MNLIKIKSCAEAQKISIRHIAVKIDMSENNLHKCIKDNRIEAGDLEKIAKILSVPVGYFFEETESKALTISLPSAMQTKIDCANCSRLEKMLSQQERIINRLETDLDECRGKLARLEAS